MIAQLVSCLPLILATWVHIPEGVDFGHTLDFKAHGKTAIAATGWGYQNEIKYVCISNI